MVEEKNQLRDELDDLIDEHDNLLEEYSGLGDQLQVQDSIIKQQISDIRGLLRKENDLKLAREKIDRLNCIDKGLSIFEFIIQDNWEQALNNLNK